MTGAQHELLSALAAHDDSRRGRAVRAALDRIDRLESLCGDAAIELGSRVDAEKSRLVRRLRNAANRGEREEVRS